MKKTSAFTLFLMILSILAFGQNINYKTLKTTEKYSFFSKDGRGVEFYAEFYVHKKDLFGKTKVVGYLSFTDQNGQNKTLTFTRKKQFGNYTNAFGSYTFDDINGYFSLTGNGKGRGGKTLQIFEGGEETYLGETRY
ncbi:MAG: hypothetical protein MUC49_14860 [Raineya sp.]|jgi:hypothetical protein|nr:hypothetical protein [Raineya sp.]